MCDFDRLEEVEEFFAVDDVFSCLGTTIKKAKMKEAMYKVDVQYPLTIAKLAKKNGARHFSFISSMNVSVKSLIWYMKMKGTLEEAIKFVRFETLSIYRPALLLGNRQEFRLGERAVEKFFHGF